MLTEINVKNLFIQSVQRSLAATCPMRELTPLKIPEPTCCTKMFSLIARSITDEITSSAIRRESAHLTWLYCTVQMAFQYETV